MATGMTSPALSAVDDSGVESLLADDLAQADRALSSVQPILRHLLGTEDHTFFSDRVVAQVRAQIEDLARQLLLAMEQAAGAQSPRESADSKVAELAEALLAESQLLGHAHALALEAQLAERLGGRLSLDPVLSPLLQSLIASPDPETATMAMNTLAAQARFIQAQRRGELALADLPGELLHVALLTLRVHCAETEPERVHIAGVLEAAIRANFDESANRLGLLQRLVAGMGGGAAAALDVAHGGIAFFATALALGAGLDRDAAVLSLSEAQMPRLALGLVACGVKPELVEQQFLALHPDVSLPEGFETLRADRAAALLAEAGAPIG